MFVNKSMVRKVITIDKDADVFSAQDKMVRHRIRHLPVVDADNRLIGIVTDRDIRSCLPSRLLDIEDFEKEKARIANLSIDDIMTKRPVTIPLSYTLQDALLVIQESRVGALPVVDEEGKLKGIVSVRDLLRSFINVLGIGEPGTLLCILVEDKMGQMKKIVDAITEENISIGSILVAQHFEKNIRAVFPYLFTVNVAAVKKKLEALGFKLLDPMQWYLDTLPQHE